MSGTVLPVIVDRYSVRKYQNRPVDREILLRLIEAARLAPSASNRQEWRFVIVTDAARRAALRDAAKGQRFVEEAPVVIAACADTNDHVMTCGEKCYPIDVAIALDHLSLQATAEGLGTCWIGAFHQDLVKAVLNIPAHIRVVELMAVGYPADSRPAQKNRKPVAEIACFEQWTL